MEPIAGRREGESLESFRTRIAGKLMPSGELQNLLETGIASRATRHVAVLGKIEIPDGVLLATDLNYYPYEEESSAVLNGPRGEATVTLELLQEDQELVAVSSVLVVYGNEQFDNMKVVAKTSIDSAIMLLGSKAMLAKIWKTGGPLSESSLYAEENAKDREAEVAKAAGLVKKAGFAVGKPSGWTCSFKNPLSDGEIGRIDSILKKARVKAKVNTFVPQSVAETQLQLRQTLVAPLRHGDKMVGVAFQAGWGDGSYNWLSLTRGKKQLGFACNFVDTEQG